MKNIRNDITTVIGETKLFYQSQNTGMSLIQIRNINSLKKKQIKLSDYQFPKDRDNYLDVCAEVQMEYWKQRLQVNDYSIPALGPWYGIAEHSAFLGGEVEYSQQTSWHKVLLNDFADMERLSMSKSNEIYQMVIGGITYIRERFGDIFAPMVRGTSGVLEIANVLRGNEFFYDIYEEPEELKKLLSYCKDSIIWYYNQQLKAAGEYYGGVVTGFGVWMPERAIGHMSEDTTTMISKEQYEEYGKPLTQEICNQFDSAFMHTHAMSERCLESIAQIKGIKLMELSSDPNTERAIEVYKRHKERIQPIPVLNLTRDEIINNMELLKSIKSVIWYEANTVEEAIEICNLIKKELPIR